MTDTIDTLNDEINGGRGIARRFIKGSKRIKDKLASGINVDKIKNMSFTQAINEKANEISNSKTGKLIGEGLGKGTSLIGEGLGKGASLIGEGTSLIGNTATSIYKNENTLKWLIGFNFLVRLILALSSLTFQVEGRKRYYIGQYKKHVKESFGITVIVTMIFVIMYNNDKEQFRGKEDRIQFTIFTLILLSIFMYDYVNIVFMLINKKFFTNNKKNQSILSMIIITTFIGIFALYYITIILSKGFPLQLMRTENLETFKMGTLFLIGLFALSVLGFFIIYPNIKEIERTQLKKNNNDRKAHFIDMFKKYYMVFILISCILLVVLNLNKDVYYKYINYMFPIPTTKPPTLPTSPLE